MELDRKGNYLMFERLFIIQEAIQHGYYPNSTVLQKKIREQIGIEFSMPTISRDIRFLKERMNYPIEYNTSKKGYYWK